MLVDGEAPSGLEQAAADAKRALHVAQHGNDGGGQHLRAEFGGRDGAVAVEAFLERAMPTAAPAAEREPRPCTRSDSLWSASQMRRDARGGRAGWGFGERRR